MNKKKRKKTESKQQDRALLLHEEEKNPIPNSLNCSKTVAIWLEDSAYQSHTTLLYSARQQQTKQQSSYAHHSVNIVYRILAHWSPAFSIHTTTTTTTAKYKSATYTTYSFIWWVLSLSLFSHITLNHMPWYAKCMVVSFQRRTKKKLETNYLSL